MGCIDIVSGVHASLQQCVLACVLRVWKVLYCCKHSAQCLCEHGRSSLGIPQLVVLQPRVLSAGAVFSSILVATQAVLFFVSACVGTRPGRCTQVQACLAQWVLLGTMWAVGSCKLCSCSQHLVLSGNVVSTRCCYCQRPASRRLGFQQPDSTQCAWLCVLGEACTRVSLSGLLTSRHNTAMRGAYCCRPRLASKHMGCLPCVLPEACESLGSAAAQHARVHVVCLLHVVGPARF
jgi:hypothetical protein